MDDVSRGKNDEYLRVYMSESVLADLKHVAKRDRRDPSEYVRLMIEEHLYGHPAVIERSREGDDAARR